jgi:predicted TIM-barrel fold metal-dependent hydrolase
MDVKSVAGVIVLALAVASSGPAAQAPPIIDVHLHADNPEEFFAFIGLTAPDECALPRTIPPLDVASASPAELAGRYFKARLENCTTVLKAAANDADLLRRTLAILERRNILAVTSSTLENVQKWKAAAAPRIIPGLAVIDPQSFIPDQIRERITKNEVRVLGEVATQYLGILPSDPGLEPIFALAEELDVPVGVHIGASAPGIPVVTLKGYRAAASRPLELEQVLLGHPRLRLYVMHAGWPMADEMIHLLWSFPQVYVDIAVIDWFLPRQEFHAYLKRLIDAGFGKRIMFGSDQMVWPEAIEVAIENVGAAPFLTTDQKRDILYNNAARFLRLDARGSNRP